MVGSMYNSIWYVQHVGLCATVGGMYNSRGVCATVGGMYNRWGYMQQ